MKTELIDLKENTESRRLIVVDDTQFVLISDGGEHDIQLIFEKSGITAEILGLFMLGLGQNLKIRTSSQHNVSNTTCTTFIKTILLDDAIFDYVGKILITKNGNQTNAYLNDRVLMLGDKARTNSQPILEIEANDVKASHSAAAGNVDESQLYYLMSRGLSRELAVETIMEGFFDDALSKIIDEKVREKVADKVKSK